MNLEIWKDIPGNKNWKMSIMVDGIIKQVYFDDENKAYEAYKKELGKL